MVEDELREFLGRVGLAGLKPVHRDTEFRCEFAERLDARCASFGFKPADVGVADTLACELALAESQLKSPPLDPVSDCSHVRDEALAAHSCLEAALKAGPAAGRELSRRAYGR